MKHYQLTSVILLAFVFDCQKEDMGKEGSNLPQYSPGAQLQQVTLYSLNSNSLPGNIIELYEYDEHGRVSRVATPGAGGMDDIAQYKTFEYDSHGNPDTISTYMANTGEAGGFLLLEVKTITYSGDGRKANESTNYSETGVKKDIVYHYDGLHLIKSEDFDEKGVLEQYRVFEYNNNGTLKKETVFSATGELTSYVTYSYDENRLAESFFYSFRKELVKKEKRRYDANGNLVELRSINIALWLSSVSYRLEYTYNE